MGINTTGEAQINAIEKEGFKLIVTQIK